MLRTVFSQAAKRMPTLEISWSRSRIASFVFKNSPRPYKVLLATTRDIRKMKRTRFIPHCNRRDYRGAIRMGSVRYPTYRKKTYALKIRELTCEALRRDLSGSAQAHVA